MKKISILLFIAITTIFFSCEQESIENLDEQLIVEEVETEINSKWLTYCNSFSGKVRFQLVLNPIEPYPAAQTGTLILDYCPNGSGSCYQAMQRTVRHDERFSFYVLGGEFSDLDKFRVRIIPNNDGESPTNSVFMFLGPQFGIERNLGSRNVTSGQATFNNLSFDFPDICNVGEEEFNF